MISKISLSIAFRWLEAHMVLQHFEKGSAKIAKTQATNQVWTEISVEYAKMS